MPSGYPTKPKTIGEHLRKRRMDLGLLQREVAVIIGVDTTTVFNWESNRTEPNLQTWPAVLTFLGYDPRPEGQTVGEKLRRHREGLGLSLVRAAEVMGVDPSTLNQWERWPDSRQNYLSMPQIIRFIGYNTMVEPKSPSERIRLARLISGLTQSQLAEKLRVCQRDVSGWEQGHGTPPAQFLKELERMLCVPRSTSDSM